MRKIFEFLFIFSILLFYVSLSYGQFEEFNHPELRWRTIETDHFFVHFHQQEQWAANFSATLAEKIYPSVTQVYSYEPDSKIHIVLKDTDDYANGAAYFYDNKIEIWISPIDFTLRGTNHWLSDVISHEFAHIISLQKGFKMPRSIPAFYIQGIEYEDEKREDVLYGFPDRIISFPIAGSTVPMWLAEGMAQIQSQIEGYDTWDSHRDMIIRTRILNNKFLSLKDMNVFGKTSIGNESVYNQGYAFTRYLTKRFGVDFLKNIANALSSPFVWTISSAFKKTTGKDIDKIYSEWKSELEYKYLEKLKNITKNKKEGDVIVNKGISNLYPVWSLDGKKFAYISGKGDYISLTSLYLYNPETEEEKHLVSNVSSSLSWLNNDEILYAKQVKAKNNSFFFDLHKYNIKKEKETRLTYGQRTLYPSVSPDNKYAAFSTPIGGSRNLALFNFSTKKITILTNFNQGKEVFESTWHPDGKKIIFSVSKMYGRYIAEYDLEKKAWQKLIEYGEDCRNPLFSKDGKYIYFSSDKTGIFNIYSYNTRTEDIQLLTNVLTGAFMPSVHPDNGLIYSLFKIDGYKIAGIKDINSISKELAKYNTQIINRKTEIINTKQYESEPYKNKYTKTSFIPRLFFDYGKPKLGFYAYSSEILNKLNFMASAAINKDKDYDLYASFEYRRLKPTIFLELFGISRRTEDRLQDEYYKYKLSAIEADLGIKYPIKREIMTQLKFIITRYNANITSEINGVKFRPFDYNYYIGREIIFNVKYNGIIPSMDSDINPTGRSIDFYYKRELNKFFVDFAFNEDFGTIQEKYHNYYYNQFELKWNEHHRLPFGIKRNTLNLHIQAGVIDENVDDFFYLYAGGLIGLKAYNYYSIGGRKKFIAGLTYRFPVFTNLNLSFGPFHINKVYPSVGYTTGNAWNKDILSFDALKDELKNFKNEIDLQLRCNAFFYYMYPMKIGLYASYGLDKFEGLGGPEGKKWKYYFHILFDYF